MEFSISAKSTEDSEDLFIVAKERLLDVNDWKCNDTFILADSHKNKVFRNAHTGDFILRKAIKEAWYHIDKIQYDDYPDINGESITIFLSTDADPETMHTIAINRVGKVINVKGYNIDFTGSAEQFLKGLLTNNVYAIAS